MLGSQIAEPAKPAAGAPARDADEPRSNLTWPTGLVKCHPALSYVGLTFAISWAACL